MNRYSVLLACTTALVGIIPYQAGALPQGGTVAAGSANITTGATNVDITQSTEKAIIDWQGFDVAPHESVNFAQPSANAITLNRVGSSTPSQIEGAMRANGNIIIVNPNGVVFSKDARVDVGGLVATTADIGNQQFMQSANPEFTFTGNPGASIVNHGSITAAQGGLVGLVAPNVSNHGTISAQLGRVTLASGDRFTLDLAGDGITQLSISDAVASQLVRNSGTIEANGGTITLTAAAARDTVDSLIENTGVLRATTVGEHEGTIILYAEGSNAVITNDPTQKGLVSGRSTVINSGTIDVSGTLAGEKAGTVKILGDQVALTSQARIYALGKAGGGVVRVGGDAFGQGTTPTAISTIMQSGALIDARSTLTGDAGSVVLWADNNTSFAGDIKADAEGEFGDGGFVETSGKAILNAYGTVSATSRRGRRGEWYLDPANITITTADANITGNPNFTATNTGSTVNAASIVSNLNAGTNVTITTSNDAFAGDGDIFVNSAITTTGTGSLTLSAYRNITVSANITLAGGSLTLRADNSGSGSGAISVAAAIATAGGNITMGGGNGAITAGSGFATGNSTLVNGVLLNGATLNAGGGNIIINGRGITSGSTAAVGVLLSNNTISTTGTGTISITGVGGLTSGNSNIGISFTNANAVSTAGGNLSLNGTGGGTGSSLTNHGIYINSANAVTTTGAGNILVTAQGGQGNTANSTSTGFFDNVTNALRTTGTGGITINATGGGAGQAGTDNYGFFHQGSISSNGGAILINANGAAAPSADRHYGAFIGGNISNTNGDITINATAGNAGSNSPGYRQNAGIINAGTGQITITGTRGGSGLDDYAVTGGTVGGAGQSGNITLLGNRYSVTSWSVATTGTLTVAPRTGITMDVGGSSASLNISNALLGFFSAGSYVFGSSTTGNVTVNTTNNFGNSNVTFLSGTGDVSVTGAYTSTGNGALTLSAFRHVLTTAAISLNGGAATLRSNNTGAATGVIDIGAALGTSGGNITMGGGSGAITAGSGYALGVSGRTNGVVISGAVNAGGGNILINGRGAIGINGFVHGVNVGTGGSLATTNNGTITVHGIGEGDAASGQTIGVFVNNNGSITAQHGNITLTGTGGAGTQAIGVATSTTGANISTSGNGNIIITGTGGASAFTGNHGISTNFANGITTSGAGSIYLYGTKGGSTSVGYNSGAANGVVTTGTGNVFVYADTLGIGFSNSIVSANGLTIAPLTNAATMAVGTTGSTLNVSNTDLSRVSAASYTFGSTTTGNVTVNTTNNFGNSNVTFLSGTGDVTVSGAYTSTGNGALTLSAFNNILANAAISLNGGAATLRSNNTGAGSGAIRIGSGSGISTAGGNITMGGGSGAITAGTGYAFGNAANLSGVNILATINAGSGNVIINGNGYIASSVDDNMGIAISGSGNIQTTGNGSITLNGVGGGTLGNSAANHGVAIGSYVSAQNGTITINGTGGGVGTGGSNIGVQMNGVNTVRTTGSGNIILTGTGGGSTGTTDFNYGISVGGTGNTIQTSGSGAITLTGTGGNVGGTGSNNHGIIVMNSIAGNGGTITLNGNRTGTSGSGVIHSGTITNTGDITINATASPVTSTNAFRITSGSINSGAGTISITSNVNGTGNDFLASGGTIGGAGQTGNIGLYFNSYSISGLTVSTTGTLTVAPRTNITMAVGTTGSTLNLTNTVLGMLTAGHYVFGSTTTGNLTVNTTRDFGNSNLTFLSSGNITLAGTLTKASGTGTANYLFRAYGNISNSGSAGISVGAGFGSANITLQSDFDGNDSGSISLSSGTVTSRGGNITLGGGTGTITAGSGYARSNGQIGVLVSTNQVIDAGGGNIIINGQGPVTAVTDYNYGVWVSNGSNISTTGLGTVSIHGIAGGNGSTRLGNRGIEISGTNTRVTSENGTLTLNGTGATASGDSNMGITIYGTNVVVGATGTGAVSLTGVGGGSGASTNNHGVYIDSSALVTSQSGTLTLHGTGGASSGSVNRGVTFTSGGRATSTSGAISITGIGGGQASLPNASAGILVSSLGGGISSTTGNITIVGTGGVGNAAENRGFSMNEGSITSTSGDINITGNGGSGSGTSAHGLILDGAGTPTISSGGNITLRGFAGGIAGDGVTITRANAVLATGTGNIMAQGVRTGGSAGIALTAANALRTSGTGSISIASDNYNISASNAVNSAGTVTVATYSNISLGVGTASTGTLVLTDTQLSNLTAATGYIFGSLTTATATPYNSTLTVNTARDFGNSNLTFLSGGNIVLAGSLTKASGTGTANYLFRAHGNITNSGSAGIITNSGSSNITLHSDFDDNNNGAINFTNGSITSNGGSITLGGGSNIATDYAYGNATNTSGVALNGTDVNAGAGTLTVRGRGRDAGTLTYGVLVNSGAKLRGTGTINVTGLGGMGTDDSYGIYVNGTNSTIAGEGAGTVTLNGTGQGSGTRSAGVRVQSGGVTSVVSGGTLNITGHSLGLGNNERGVIVSGTNSAIRGTGTGIVNITGTVANSGTGTGHVGVYSNSLGIMSTVDGTLTINGTGGGGTSSGNSVGVIAVAGGQIRTTGAGNLLITGQGGTLGTTAGNNHGIASQNAGGIETTGTGSITLNGTAGAPASSFGVYTDSAGGIRSTGSGNITVNADTLLTTTSGALNSINTLIIAPRTNAGTLALGTTGSTLNLSNTELANHTAASYIFGNNTTGDITVNTTRDFGNSNVTFTTPANITLSGNLTKASGTGTADYIFNGNTINLNTSNTITASSGAINLSFTGAGNVFFRGNTLSTNGGSITLSKNAFLQSGTLTLNSAGGNVNINNTLNGTTADTQSLTVNAGAGTFTTAAAIGNTTRLQNLSVTADNVALGGNLSGSGTLTLRPSSTTRVIRVNDGTADFNLSTTEVGYIQDGWSSITLGNSVSSAQLYLGASTWYDSLILYNGTKNLLGSQTMRGTASFSSYNNSFIMNGHAITTEGGSTLFHNEISGVGGSISTAGGSFTHTGVWLRDLTISTSGGNITANSITQPSATIYATALDAGSGNVSLSGTINNTGNVTLNGNTVSVSGAIGNSSPLTSLTITAANSLSLPSITAGSILVRTTGASADLTLASGTTLTATGAGNALTLVAGRNFINSSGATALSTPSGRWLVYSSSMAANTRGGLLPDASNFGQTYAGNPPATIGTGNRFIYSSSTRPTLAYDVNDGSVTYGDTYTHTNGATYASGLLAGDTLGTIGLTGSASFGSSYVAGTTNASATPYAGIITGSTGTLASVLGYDFSFTAGDLTVNRRTITPTLAGTVAKTYDGTITANFASGNFTLANTIGGDDISVAAGTGSYNTKDTATGKNVSITGLTLSGADAGNYLLSTTSLSGAIGTITQKSATITVANATRLQGTANPSFSASYAGLVGGDTSAVISGLTFNTGAVTNSPIGTYAITASGATATNYIFTYVNGVLTITAGTTAPAPDPTPTPAPTTSTNTTTLSQLVEQKRRIEDTIIAESSINTLIVPGSTTGGLNNVIIIENRVNNEPSFSTFNPANDCESCTTL